MEPRHPTIFLHALDNLWFQVGGTLCNLACEHCFINCGPRNHSFEFMTRQQVHRTLEESRQLGVKEYYFTGGEPFMNPQIMDILDMTLEAGPITLLTNGTLLKEEGVKRMAKMDNRSLYSLEIRISLDGHTEETNDAIRGMGVFKKVMAGVTLLIQHGFLPIITVTKTWEDQEDGGILRGFKETLTAYGYERPRIKVLPSLKLGREAARDRPYHQDERVTNEMEQGLDPSQFLCSNTRIATSRGVYVCPILIEEEKALLGESLKEAMGGFELRYQACFTCYLYGAICSNISFEEHYG
ncbi:MAG: radical SAM protein [Pseudomonadota bacterium]